VSVQASAFMTLWYVREAVRRFEYELFKNFHSVLGPEMGRSPRR
jgi:hypothetical protein